MKSSSSGISLQKLFNFNKGYVWFLYLLTIIVLFLSRFVSPSLASWSGLKTILIITSVLAVVAFGEGIVILVGELDLSVTSTITLAGIFTTAWMGDGGSTVLGLVKVFSALIVVGLINGVFVAYLNIPSFIMTLAVQIMTTGFVLGFTGGTALGSAPQFLVTLMSGNFLGLPLPIWVLIVFGILASLVQSKTVFGRRLYAIGSNFRAAKVSGISVGVHKVGVFVVSAICAGIAGMLLVGYSSGATLTMGDSYLMPTIAAVVIGGSSITGGRGYYVGTIGATILLTMVSTIVNALGTSEGWQTFIYGLLIVAVLVLLRIDFGAIFGHLFKRSSSNGGVGESVGEVMSE